MEVPARFIRFSPTHRGIASDDGWLEIDVRALDLDGVSKLYVNLSDVAKIKQKRDAAAMALNAWDTAFAKKDDGAKEPAE